MLVRCSALFCLVVFTFVASDKITVKCFKSGSAHVKFVQVSTIDAQPGYVLYKKSSALITLISEKIECEDNDDERPQACNSLWLEVVNGKVNGTYQFDYIAIGGVNTKFNEDLDACNSESSDCVWK